MSIFRHSFSPFISLLSKFVSVPSPLSNSTAISTRKTACNSKMGEDLFKSLPSEITFNILSRLPAKAAMSGKCVCKPWLHMLETAEFVESHLSKPVPGIVVFIIGEYAKPYKVFEFVDELKPRDRPWNMIFNFNLPCNAAPPYSSADGLLFLCTRGMILQDVMSYDYVDWPRDLFICNPITRKYIKLPCPPESSFSAPQVQMDTFGFGLSRTSGQYKLVRIFHEWDLVDHNPALSQLGPSKCQVYTVGTGLWSNVSSPGPFKYEGNAKGAFLKGNLHWLARGFEDPSVSISCFDLETEVFSTFALPPCNHDRGFEECLNVSVLKDCLCVCDNSADDEIVLWLMKDYGVEKSWKKEFVIVRNDHVHNGGLVWPIKAFENGDILMALETCNKLLYYSGETKTIEAVDVFGLESAFVIYTTSFAPSFLPLKTVALENVTSF